MSRIGLKYISTGALNFPAINGGKWNLASYFKGDFHRILSESGIGKEDYDSVALYMKFVATGMFLCCAKRSMAGKKDASETLWLFVPYGTVVSPKELAGLADELLEMFDHPEAFSASESFQDMLPSLFLKDFEEVAYDNEVIPMTGSRIGYINYEEKSELELILSSGFKSQYENYGLILLTDNPVPVEASLPRIYLPELMLHRQLKREADTHRETDTHNEPVSEEVNEEQANEPILDEDLKDDGQRVEIEENESLVPEDVTNKEEFSNKEEVINKSEEETAEEMIDRDDLNPVELTKEVGTVHGSFSAASFWGGFITASVIFLLIYIVVHVCQNLG